MRADNLGRQRASRHERSTARSGRIITESSLRSADLDIGGVLRAVDALARCEPDADQVRDTLLWTAMQMSGADGVALFDADRGEVACWWAVGACRPLLRLRLSRADTLIGPVVVARDPVVVDVDPSAAEPDAQRCRDLGLTTMLMLPMRRGRNANGVLLAAYRDADQHKAAVDEALQCVVQIAAARLEHLAMASEREADDRLVAAIADAGRAVLTSDDPAQALCDRARTLTGAMYAAFAEPAGSGDLIMTAQSGAQLPKASVCVDDDVSLPALAFRSGRAQIVHDFKRHPEAHARVSKVLEPAGLADARSAAYLPVRTGQSTLGVICLVLDEPFVLGTMTVLGLVGMLAAEAALAIDRDRLRRELERQASTDALTGMANRRTYATHLSRELARAKRTNGNVSLVLVDLDHFKGYNDHHGHLAGDVLLRTVASGWMGQLREVDLLARLGGDEFAVVLADTDAEAGLVMCRRLLEAMPEGVTASAGIAQWNGDEDQSTLYRRCDEALYAAKNSGRNAARIAP